MFFKANHWFCFQFVLIFPFIHAHSSDEHLYLPCSGPVGRNPCPGTWRRKGVRMVEDLVLRWKLGGFVLDQGSSPSGPRTSTGPWPVRNLATQQEVSSRWNWNHTPTPPAQPRSMGNLSSVKLRPGNIKFAECCSRQNGIERLLEKSWLGNH